MKRCLLVTPLSFYSWHSAVKLELENIGYKVDIINDEYPNNTLGLIIGNILNRISQKLTLKTVRTFLKSQAQYDLILIFKGRGVSSDLVDDFNRHSKRTIAYNFDSFGYFPNSLKWYKKVSSYKSFDYVNSQQYGLKQVDLYSDKKLEEIVPKTIDISCIMKNHSDRLKYLDEVYGYLGSDYNFKILIYEKNIFTYLRGAIKNPYLFYKWRKSISFVGLTGDEFFSVLASSKYTLDYAHPTQSGLTMRSFQAFACGTKLISNNKHLRNCELVDENAFYIHPLNGHADTLVKHIRENINKKSTIVFRGISEFINDLLK